jgi:hypothetical protein
MKYGTLKINEDVVVPRSRVPELVAKIEEIGKRNDTFVANFGHAGDGNIHVNFVVDREDKDAIARARKCVAETFQLAIDLGGHHLRRTRHRLRKSTLSWLRHQWADARDNERHQEGIRSKWNIESRQDVYLKHLLTMNCNRSPKSKWSISYEKNRLLLLFLLLISAFSVAGYSQNKIIVLVRHAEKMDASADPELSDAGKARAQSLIKKAGKYRPKEIYSTDFKRTRDTVKPIADKRHVQIQIYDPRDQKALAAKDTGEPATNAFSFQVIQIPVPALAKPAWKKRAVQKSRRRRIWRDMGDPH